MKCVLNKNISKEVSEYFFNKNYEIIYTEKSGMVSGSVGYHHDIQFASINSILFTSSEFFKYFSKYTDKILVSENELTSPYPFDALFNFLKIGNIIFGNKNCLDKVVLDYIYKNNIEFCHVNQGYTNCSSLPVSDTAVITSDNGMKNVFEKYGFDVLNIDNSTIKLDGFKNGFIGGASCRIRDEIIFFGNIKSHPDYDRIALFLKKHNKIYKEFSFPLEDFGGAVFFE